MRHKIRSFFRLSTRRQLLLPATFGLSVYTWILMRFFKKHATFGQEQGKISEKTIDSTLISDIRFAIYMVNKYAFYENVCRHQAYQAKLLCQSYDIPYQIYIGFKKNEASKIEGHAWTMVQGEMVTGFCKPEEYTVLAVYFSNE